MYYVEEIEIEKAEALLEACGLSVPRGIDYTAGVFNDDGKLVATGSLKGDMIQGIAVDPDFQGEDLTAKIFTHLIQTTTEESLYLFTKPDKVQQFVGLGMRHVATARPYAALLEWGKEGVKDFQGELKALVKEIEEAGFKTGEAGGNVAALVMNCNPFTLGHRHLIEKAASEADVVYVFVVEENASLFSFEDRLQMVQMGTADLGNVLVLGGGRYMISEVTFPSYFTKEENFAAAHAAMDAEIFASCIAPVLKANRRYVGTEPNSAVTAVYNEALKKRLPKAGVEVIEVPRLEDISASKVRGLLYKLLAKEFTEDGEYFIDSNFDEICQDLMHLLPFTSLEYIMSPAMEAKLCRALNYGEARWK
ncbi:MAG: adenylyltransferase/cytidyltransferase family protein [Firmicutes bacterium]|nr:adenylyltransferase/cytidyltransferase family protein [Bacillota bacterium]